MIRRIKLLRHVGAFRTDPTVESHNFKRVVLIYAENGSGKTTLAEVLRSLETGDESAILKRRRFGSDDDPHVILECDEDSQVMFLNGSWSGTPPRVRVFDEIFVDKNVYSGLDVEPRHRKSLHDFVLGEEGVALSRRKQEMVQLVEESGQRQRNTEGRVPDGERHGLSMDEFCELPYASDIDAEIKSAREELKAAQHRDAICQTLPFGALALPRFDKDAIGKTLSQGLMSLNAAAEARVREHVESCGRDVESWISDGMKYAPDGTEKTCPFCGQEITVGSLVEHYRDYFSDEYANLKSDISDTLTKVQRTHSGAVQEKLRNTVETNRTLETFWSQFCDVPLPNIDTEAVIGDWTAARAAVIGVLGAKLASPLEPRQWDEGVLETHESRRQEIEAVNAVLAGYNNSIKQVQERTSGASIEEIEIRLDRLKATKARHSQDIAPLCAEYLQAKATKAEAEEKRDGASRLLEEYRTGAFQTLQAEVNEHLAGFNSGFSIDGFQPVNRRFGSMCEYGVRVNETLVSAGKNETAADGTADEPTMGSTLSTGDRSTLALALFFSSRAKDKNLKDSVIVVDDPVSSLDEYRSMTTAEKIHDLAKEAGQVIVLSHNKQFLSQVWKAAGPEDCLSLKIDHHDTGSVIRDWGMNLESNAEQTQRQRLLEDYAKNKSGDPKDVAEAIRKYLEASLEKTCASRYRASKSFMNFISACRDVCDTPDEILVEAVIDELEKIHRYASRFHHGSRQAWQSEDIVSRELQAYARRALTVIKPSMSRQGS